MTDTTQPVLLSLRLFEGTWEGLLTGLTDPDHPPELEVICGDHVLGDPQMTRQDDHSWRVSVSIPPETISDGMQVYTISDRRSHEPLGSFAIVGGEPLRDDIRAEVALLRAELDMLKRAFRRQAREQH